ncbi:MAG TPA: hypothetical protein VEQ61_01805 [Thermoleophilaceae bacterium]|nr:hypothetical protein [Thermoleophilaceae bacterium]
MRSRSPALAVALAATLAACGGSDSPTKDDFAADANSVCKDVAAKLNAVKTDSANPRVLMESIDKVIDESRAGVMRLKAIERPDGKDGEVAKKFVDTLGRDLESKTVPAHESIKAGLRANSQAKIRKAARQLDAAESSAAYRYAKQAGAGECPF